MSSPKLVIIGHTNIDVNRTPTLVTTLPGGAGYFAAIAASRIVRPVGLVTRIGKDFNTDFLFTRVLPDGVKRIPGGKTGTCTLTYEKNKAKRELIVDWGVNLSLVPSDIPKDWISSITFIHIGTMHPEQQERFITFLRNRHPEIQLSLDTDIFLLGNPETRDMIVKNIRMVDLVFVNRLEYRALKSVIDDAPHAVVKLDKEGAMYLSHGKKLFHIPPVKPIEVLDATGAGDIFAGTFLASRIKGCTIQEAIEEAVQVASLSVSQVGVSHLFKN